MTYLPQTTLAKSSATNARAILKWAGGKSQLIEQISSLLPQELKVGKIRRYAEPFIGGGAVFFYIAQTYNIDDLYISDRNQELILLYQTLKRDVESLIEILAEIETKYFALTSIEQNQYFYEIRSKYNQERDRLDFSNFSSAWLKRAAQIIFLNRTCFNGLFRVNSQGDFNVPCGKYKNPRICDRSNLLAVSQVLQRANIIHADFSAVSEFVTPDTFVYFDPPYRPISKTANFNSYSRYDFNDSEQNRLAKFYRQLDGKGAKLMLSNSDPQNEDPNDDFFEILYQGFNIKRVSANRSINSKASKRGAIAELLITNY
jgi:DNA adenine methylase